MSHSNRKLILFSMMMINVFLVNSSNLAFAGFYEFKEVVLKKDSIKASSMIRYPLKRSPLVVLKNQDEFVNYFDKLIDQNLLQLFTSYDEKNSEVIENWAGKGYLRGDFWFEGDLLIAFNYMSEKEKLYLKALEAQERNKLHASLNGSINLELICHTNKFMIRIDRTIKGKIRYASWDQGKTISDKPNIVLENGAYKMEGTIGQQTYSFKNGVYRYVVADSSEVSEESGLYLVVEKNSKILLRQRCKI